MTTHQGRLLTAEEWVNNLPHGSKQSTRSYKTDSTDKSDQNHDFVEKVKESRLHKGKRGRYCVVIEDSSKCHTVQFLVSGGIPQSEIVAISLYPRELALSLFRKGFKKVLVAGSPPEDCKQDKCQCKRKCVYSFGKAISLFSKRSVYAIFADYMSTPNGTKNVGGTKLECRPTEECLEILSKKILSPNGTLFITTSPRQPGGNAREKMIETLHTSNETFSVDKAYRYKQPTQTQSASMDLTCISLRAPDTSSNAPKKSPKRKSTRSISKTPKTCQATIKTGKNKGNICERPVKKGDCCGYHCK